MPAGSLQRRLLPHTGGIPLHAVHLHNSSTGSFWLPELPPGGVATPDPSSGNGTCAAGFMRPAYVRLMMAQGFNAGDFLAYFVAPLVAGRVAALPAGPCSIAVVGSILQWGIRFVWGPGFIDNRSSSTYRHRRGQRYYAVRGPKSWAQLREATAQATPRPTIPAIFGDAGALAAWFYQPHNQTKRHELCFVPHYVDEPVARRAASWRGATLLSMRLPLFGLLDELVRCRFVFASSLHGLIFADSFGVPNAHMVLSSIVQGGAHKFEDYFASVGRQHAPHDWRRGSLPTLREARAVAEAEQRRYRLHLNLALNLAPFWQVGPRRSAPAPCESRPLSHCHLLGDRARSGQACRHFCRCSAITSAALITTPPPSFLAGVSPPRRAPRAHARRACPLGEPFRAYLRRAAPPDGRGARGRARPSAGIRARRLLAAARATHSA